MDRIEDFGLFLRVIDHGSISGAARSLGISVAVASQRLARLESSLGVRLFHRTTRRLQLTSDGAAFAEQARPLIEDLEALTGNLRQSSRDVGGTLRVTVPAAFGKQYISPLLPDFLARHPQLTMSVEMNDRMQDLAGEGFDLAIRIGQVNEPGLVARRLLTNRRVLCASPDYLRKRGTPRKPQDLADHECLVMLGDKEPRDSWTFRAKDGTQSTVRVHGRLQTNLGEVVREAAVAGLGISLHSTWHVCDDLSAGRLVAVLRDYELPESAIFAVMPPRRLVLPRVRVFIDFLAERFGTTPPWERKLNMKASGKASPIGKNRS
jgi:DNA-binding transcriptional LysR family regulator